METPDNTSQVPPAVETSESTLGAPRLAVNQVGGHLEAALRERQEQALKDGSNAIHFQGKDYLIHPGLTGAALYRLSRMSAVKDEESFLELVEAIRSSLQKPDGDEFLEAAFDAGADVEFLSGILEVIIETASARPTNKQ